MTKSRGKNAPRDWATLSAQQRTQVGPWADRPRYVAGDPIKAALSSSNKRRKKPAITLPKLNLPEPD